MFADTAIEINATGETRWGLLTIIAPDRSIVETRVLDAAETAAIHAKAATGAEVLVPGTDAEMRAAGFNWSLASRPCLPGQGIVVTDGSLVVNYGWADHRLRANVAKIAPDEWQLVDGVVRLEVSVKRRLGL